MDKKTKLEETAVKMFVDLGFHGTATAKIAKEAGVANGTLFNYFPTKDDLVHSLYSTILDEVNTELKENIHTPSVKDVFKERFNCLIKWSLKNTYKYRFLHLYHFSPFYAKRKKDQSEEEFTQLVQKGMDYGLIQKLPVPLVQQFIDSHTYSVHSYLSECEMSDYQQGKLIETSFDSLWRMLR